MSMWKHYFILLYNPLLIQNLSKFQSWRKGASGIRGGGIAPAPPPAGYGPANKFLITIS